MKIVSIDPRKQRQTVRELGLHLRKKNCICHLSKELRKEMGGKRAMTVRTGDKVKIMRGSLAGKDGKVLRVDRKKGAIFIEKIVRKKADGKEKQLAIVASNAMIVELDRTDDRRFAETAKSAAKENSKEPAKKVAEKEDIWTEKKEEKIEKKEHKEKLVEKKAKKQVK